MDEIIETETEIIEISKLTNKPKKILTAKQLENLRNGRIRGAEIQQLKKNNANYKTKLTILKEYNELKNQLLQEKNNNFKIEMNNLINSSISNKNIPPIVPIDNEIFLKAKAYNDRVDAMTKYMMNPANRS